MLGPTADAVGADLAHRYDEWRARNIARVGKNAEAKLGDRVNDDGLVPPRVAQRVLEEASACDAPVMAEYFGGILAASRTPGGQDDRGASWAGLISRLASFDVYLHFLIYDAIRREFAGADFNLGIDSEREKCRIYVPGGNALQAMGLEVTAEQFSRVVVPSLHALVREGLVEERFSAGPTEFLDEQAGIDAPDIGFLVAPSAPGIELFLWAHGLGSGIGSNALIDGAIAFDAVEDLQHVNHARSVSEMRTSVLTGSSRNGNSSLR